MSHLDAMDMRVALMELMGAAITINEKTPGNAELVYIGTSAMFRVWNSKAHHEEKNLVFEFKFQTCDPFGLGLFNYDEEVPTARDAATAAMQFYRQHYVRSKEAV